MFSDRVWFSDRNIGSLWETKRKGVHVRLNSDIPKLKRPNKTNLRTWAKDGCKINISTTPSIQLFNAGFQGPSGFVDLIDTIDRKGNAYANATYGRAGTYAEAFTNKPGKRVPKAGAYAECGVGEANAEWSVFQANAKGPNAGAQAGASATGVSAMATAGVGTASANAGPVGVKVGLQLDTGASAGIDGVEAKVLGIGFSLGPTTSVSFLGSELSFKLF